ncbi:SIR2 family NAD-dependent protein deacylase [Pseudorhodoferax sp.]|uniref:SIR2 family NAD-dependent protein deacylase n=1 Tax=Pseudorhodoferax sp. TaxID=1993553 RepID=UPI0039E3D395
MNDLDPAYQRAAQLLAGADALLVAAGAGMGVDSGLPDFRGPEGFWRAYPALRRARLDFYSVASPATFERDPALAWGFYGHRLALYRRTPPHPGFALLDRWGARMRAGWSVFTSNVDGHFQQAGCRPAALLECHGSIHHLQCLHDCRGAIWPADAVQPEVDEAHCRLLNAPPRCPHCGALARPNILMFGDGDWNPGREQAQATALQDWLAGLRQARARLVVVEIGAGTAVPSVRHFVQQLQRGMAARLVRINPREPAVDAAGDVALAQPALAALQAIDRHWAAGGFTQEGSA